MINKNILSNKELNAIVLYIFSFSIIIFLVKLLFYPGLLAERNFLYWDAEHYYWIKNNGYEGFRVAFFPLFPLVWKFLTVGVYGISLFNAIVFLTSYYLLVRLLKISIPETVLYLSIPSFIFFYLPYTESIFFAASTLLIMGLKNRRTYPVLLGLLLCTLSRPAFTVLIPAIIISELLCETANLKLYLRLGSYVAVVLLGVLVVGLVQYHYTGEWFEFFNAQKGWGNKLQMPGLPLTSWGGGLIVRLDGAAMLFGTTAGIVLVLKIFKVKFLDQIDFPKEVIFSLGYLAGMTLIVLFFRGGSLFSLNRFVFAAPFIIVATNFFFSLRSDLNNKRMLVAFLLIFCYCLLLGSYVHIVALLKFLLLSLYLFLVLGIKSINQVVSRISMILLTGINFFFQIFFYIRFLQGGWIG